MCGIFALLLNRPLNDDDIALGRRGTKALAHRGPDGSGEWYDRDRGVYFGHRRLAIIDLSDTNAQPFSSRDLVVTYNGEIYNFQQIRERLTGLGESFITSGDVEMLVAAWRHWGVDCLDLFDGMYAFALWDGEECHLAVDPFGEKPLYYAETGDGIYVASELAPLVKELGLEPCVSQFTIAAFMTLGSIPAPDTAFKDTRRLPPGSVATISRGRISPSRRYWTPSVGRPGRGPVRPLSEENIDQLRDALLTSLERRYIADVPVALFLSAGVDSSLIAALTSRELARDVESITVSFSSPDVVDESQRASTIARHLGIQHRMVANVDDDSPVDADALLDMFAQPSDRITAFSVRQISRAIAGEYKVAITGMGGDEVTAGYNKYVHFYVKRHWYGLPEWARVGLGACLHLPGQFIPRVASLRRQYLVRDREAYAATKNYPAIDWLRCLPGFPEWSQDSLLPNQTALHLWLVEHELTQTMADEHLLMYDLASMRESIELRTPFLSRSLVETVAEFDPRALIAFGQKSVLRKLLKRYLPTSLVDQPKWGFTYPPSRFLAGWGERCPAPGQIPDDMVKSAWAKRQSSYGWSRIGMRLAVLDAFARREPSRTALNRSVDFTPPPAGLASVN